MTISTGSYVKSFHDLALVMGQKKISSDMAFEIQGYEQYWLLCKQFPWPVLSIGEAIETPTPLGTAMWTPSQIKIHHQGSVTFEETVTGSIDTLLLDLLKRPEPFNAKVYEGTPQKYLNYKPIYGCTMSFENPDRDWENRSQILLLSGTIFFHYYGEIIAGNSSDYR